MSRQTHQVSFDKQMSRTMLAAMVPLVLIILAQLFMLLSYAYRYNAILHNVTAASEFNQSFKERIDLQMYYYVVDSRYSTGLPVEEVVAAQELARNLLSTTTDKESLRAISSVLSLSENLEDKIYKIADTKVYDERQTQLEDNIYILTDLIQEYMYTYLYHEAVYLSAWQEAALHRVRRETAVLAVGAFLMIAFISVRQRKANAQLAAAIGGLGRRVEDIGGGAFDPAPLPVSNITELNTLAGGVEQMAARLQALMQSSRQEQASLRKAELALLQSQINPHFLYNTLDTIVWLIETDKPAQAEEMVSNLSRFFRTSLSNGRDIISVREEAEHVRSYMEIQQVRYRDILSYNIEIDPATSDCHIPKLTLQPLVENSLYHGIKLLRHAGHIAVTSTLWGEQVLLTVRDDGPGLTPERLAQVRAALEKTDDAPIVGFGLATVHRRIRLLYGAPYGLTIESAPGATTVTVCLPLYAPDAEKNSNVVAPDAADTAGAGKTAAALPGFGANGQREEAET